MITSESPFAQLVHVKLLEARSKHPKPFRDPMHGLAVCLKQFQDAQDKAFAGRPREEILRELAQLGAMAQRTAEDCKLIP